MILAERDGGLFRLWLARGGARNAVPVAGWRAMADAARAMAVSDARAVIIASRDASAFSAGADIREFGAMCGDPAAAEAFLDAMRDAIDGIAALPMPVIAAVDGGCFGAAVALAIAADVVIAGDGARFATTPAKLGLLYPQTDIDRLAARVGPGMAALMLLSGNEVSADRAVAAGLATLRAPHAGEAAEALAARIAANAPGAVRSLKAQLRGALADPRGAFLDRFTSAELAERLEAFR